MNAVIWCLDMCYDTMFVKGLLKSKGYTIEERIVDDLVGLRESMKVLPDDIRKGKYTSQQLMAASPLAKDIRAMSPQIFLDGQYIGGYEDLKKHFQEMEET